MNCKNCLVELPEESLFCNNCGHIIPFKEYNKDLLPLYKSEEINDIKLKSLP